MPSNPAKIILVMGVTGTGKTSFINSASGSRFPVTQSLDSCTDGVVATAPFDLDGHRVVLVDTPGFGHSSKRDFEVLRPIARYLVKPNLLESQISGVVYMHPFPEYPCSKGTAKHYFSVFSELCGSMTLDHVSIVMTRWNGHHSGSGSQLEMDFQAVFDPVVKAGGCIVRDEQPYSQAREIVRTILDKNPVVLQLQRELTVGRKLLRDTAAGTALSKRQEVTHGFWKKLFDMLFMWMK